MISNTLADKLLQKELDRLDYRLDFDEDLTLRCFMQTMFQIDCDEESFIGFCEENADTLVDVWVTENGKPYSELVDYLVKNLDTKVEVDIKIDKNYDSKPERQFPSLAYPNGAMTKECKFRGTVKVNDCTLYLDPWYVDFPCDDLED